MKASTLNTLYCTYSKNPRRDEDQDKASELSGGQTESLLDNCTDTEEESQEEDRIIKSEKRKVEKRKDGGGGG